MIPLQLSVIQSNDEYSAYKNLWEIFEPDKDYSSMSEEECIAYAIENKMFPTEVKVNSETYSKNAERTADYELNTLTLINAKSKPEFTWNIIKASYVQNLLSLLGFTYDYKDSSGSIVPVEASKFKVKYWDFSGQREIYAYLGQSIDGTLVEYGGVLYWEDFRVAFPER